MMTTLYNENEPFAAEWLRSLTAGGHIAPGSVDERSIRDLRACDVQDATQVHFFAGIGGWSYALRLAGWPDDAPVWTGSCPCQPFSRAGKRRGIEDERHLWPEWLRLIGECRPPVLFGEQVASPDGRAWLATVRTDLEALGYAVGAADLCAAGVGAPHQRQRLWFGAVRVGDGEGERRGQGHADACGRATRGTASEPRPAHSGGALRLGSPSRTGPQGRELLRQCARQRPVGPAGVARGVADHASNRRREGSSRGDDGQGLGPCVRGATGGVGDPNLQRREGLGVRVLPGRQVEAVLEARGHGEGGPWARAEWALCGDGKARPFEPSALPLADGVPDRVGRIRGYGNAIVPQVAAEFIRAFAEAR